MKASNQKQLNIRNDDAHRLAHEIADRLSVPVTEAVTRALRDYASKLPRERELTADQKADVQALRAIIRKYRQGIDPQSSPPDDHDWLYDEHGLPK